ncbi:MAG TPA: hypothetical protein VKS78_10260 [Roseiarcus sp.]|nr:hypothetical protein [Roseiarcus sp.]
MRQEGLATLSAFRERLHEQLMNVPEYRALAVIDWTIHEVTQILGPAPLADRKIAPATDRPTATASNVPSTSEPAAVSDIGHSRMVAAIAETIEATIAPPKPRLPNANLHPLFRTAS